MIHLHTHMHIYIVFILDHVVRGHPHHTHATRIRERTNLLDVQSWSWRAETSALVFLGDYVTWLGEPWEIHKEKKRDQELSIIYIDMYRDTNTLYITYITYT